MSRRGRRIFISYRRSDTAGHAGWLQQILEDTYGRSHVFRDLDAIQPGQHFPTRIARTIADCTDMFVLIGPGWLEPGPDGRPRLLQAEDWVRLELETAIHRGLPLLPLLVGSAAMPGREALPPSLHPLADRQFQVLRDGHFAEDVRQALARLDEAPTGVEHLGARQVHHEDRVVELMTLLDGQIRQARATVRLLNPAERYRPQLRALAETLEPDEDVADVVLATWWQDDETGGTDTRTAQTAIEFGRKMLDTSFQSVLAVTPRRLVLAPWRKHSGVAVAWYRDVVDVKLGAIGRITGQLTVVLRRSDILISVTPTKRASVIADYVRNRLDRR
ncbi:MAG: toll/interleukin-1 receptor domain-containing protein [Pseudonocardia sp.]